MEAGRVSASASSCFIALARPEVRFDKNGPKSSHFQHLRFSQEPSCRDEVLVQIPKSRLPAG